MKRLCSLFICLILLLGCCIHTLSAQADRSFKDSNELFQFWAENRYPDYVCGVYSTDGSLKNLCVIVLNNEEGERGKQEILESISDKKSVSFEYGRYSYNELRAVQAEVDLLFEKEIGIVSTAVDEKENLLIIGADLENATQELNSVMDSLKSKYGEMIRFEQNSGVIDLAGKVSNNLFDFTPVILIAIGFSAMLFVFMKRKSRAVAFQTNTGEIVSGTAHLTTKQIEKLVKESVIAPTPNFDADFMKKIQNYK